MRCGSEGELNHRESAQGRSAFLKVSAGVGQGRGRLWSLSSPHSSLTGGTGLAAGERLPSIISSLGRVERKVEERVVLMMVEKRLWDTVWTENGQLLVKVGQGLACLLRWRYEHLANNTPILLMGKLRSRERKAVFKVIDSSNWWNATKHTSPGRVEGAPRLGPQGSLV